MVTARQILNQPLELSLKLIGLVYINGAIDVQGIILEYNARAKKYIVYFCSNNQSLSILVWDS